MKLSFSSKLYVFVVVLLQTKVLANDDEVDCTSICKEQIQPYISKEAVYEEEKIALLKQLEEVKVEREQISLELDKVRKELEVLQGVHDDASRVLENTKLEIQQQYNNEISELKKTIETTNTDMAHYQKVAQDNQKYMQEYKNQLHSQRDKANKLQEALNEANAKIVELESTTFIKQLRKEVMLAWNAIVEYWMTLKNKGKSEADAEF